MRKEGLILLALQEGISDTKQVSVLTPDEAHLLVQTIHAGDSRSKQRGISCYLPPTGPLVKVELPLSDIRKSTIEYMRQSTDVKRVAQYVKERITTPIYLQINQKGHLIVKDGGHRLLAAIERGDRTINVLMPAGYSRSGDHWIKDEKVSEAIRRDPVTGKVDINYQDPDKSQINTALGKSTRTVKFQPRITSLPNSRIKVASIYARMGGDEVNDILRALKHSKGYEGNVEQNAYSMFINRAAIFFGRYLQGKKVDTILTMPSSSDLVRDFATKVREKLPDVTIQVFSDSFKKDVQGLEIARGGLSDTETRVLQGIIDQAKTTGELEMRKIPGKLRKFIRGWMQVDSQMGKHIKGKNVVLIDDYLTTGSTLDAAASAVQTLLPASLNAITLLK